MKFASRDVTISSQRNDVDETHIIWSNNYHFYFYR